MTRSVITGIFLLLLFLSPAPAQIQSTIDSLENKLDKADRHERAEILLQISEMYWQRSFDTSLLMAIHAHNIARDLDDQRLTANAYYMIGNAYYFMGDYTSSMENYLEALAIREELGDSNSIANSYNNIGAVFLHMEDEKNALAYFKQAGEIYDALGDDTQLFAILNNIGAVYIDQEIYDTAFQYFSRAFEIAGRSGHQTSMSIALSNLGETALSMGLYSQSEEYLEQAYAISSSLGDMGMMATIRSNLGNLYLNRKQYDLALRSFQESLVLAREINSLPIMQENYRSLTEYYNLRGEYKQALRLHKMYSAIKDSIVSQNALMKIKELELKFNARALRQEIELLRMENELQSLRGSRLKLLIIFLAAALIALFLLLVVYSQRNRFKKEKTKLLEGKNKELESANRKLQESENHLKELNSTKDKFFSIIGHDLRNPLNALLGFSELLTGNSMEYSPEEIQKYTKIINEAAKNIHLLIENLLEWSRSQSGNMEFNPRKGELQVILNDILKIFEIQAEKKGISVIADIPDNQMIYADMNLLSTVLRNLINNAVKYTPKKGEVHIIASTADQGVEITVKDTGIGMDKEQLESLFSLVHGPSRPGTSDEKGTGLGLILCKEFVDKHGGRIWAESEPEKGSKFTVFLPDPEKPDDHE